MGELLSISWGGRIVGWIRGPRFDFPHYYGQWVAEDGESSGVFLSELRRAVDEEDGLPVILGEGTPGLVYVHPDDEDGEIDVRLR